jgi:hypothetical protein
VVSVYSHEFNLDENLDSAGQSVLKYGKSIHAKNKSKSIHKGWARANSKGLLGTSLKRVKTTRRGGSSSNPNDELTRSGEVRSSNASNTVGVIADVVEDHLLMIMIRDGPRRSTMRIRN